MSAETKTALDEALAAHINSEHDDGATIITGYALMASCVTADDLDNEQTRYFREYSENQPAHVASGLVLAHATYLDHELRSGWVDRD